jgi:quinoprotein glucose dehydrogenase
MPEEKRMTLVFSRRLLASTMAVAVLLLMVFLHAAGQSAAKDVEWRSCGADLANTHYSPLDQINGSNFSKLEAAWRFKTASVGSRPETNLQSTPLMVGGVVYSTAGTERAVVALDAVSGQLLWSHTENEGARAGGNEGSVSTILPRYTSANPND